MRYQQGVRKIVKSLRKKNKEERRDGLRHQAGDSNQLGFKKSPKGGLVTQRRELGRGCLLGALPAEVWVCVGALGIEGRTG